MKDHIAFSESLIKGKIGETIFEQMLRETNNFTILPFGYEKVLPAVIYEQGGTTESPALEAIRRAPDFCVIDHDTHEVSLIEVKYMRVLKREYVLADAQKIAAAWKPALLFVATQNGFYYGAAADIIEHGGEIAPFPPEIIAKELQDKYLALLNAYIQGK